MLVMRVSRAYSNKKNTAYLKYKPYFHFLERESFSDYKKRVGLDNIRPGDTSESGSDSDDEKVQAYDG